MAVPGYIDAHGHAELFYNPSAFADCVITRGTTTVYSDGHDMINSIGLPAFIRVLDSAAHYAVSFSGVYLPRIPISLAWKAAPSSHRVS